MLPLSRVATCTALVCLLAGCAGRTTEARIALPSAPPQRSLASNEPARAPQGSVAFSDDHLASEVYAVQQSAQSRSSLGSFFSVAASTTTPGVQLPAQADASAAGAEMIDIQARFAVQCDAVAACATKLRAQVQAAGGRITSDEANAGKQTEVTLELRIPSERFDAFASGVEGLGGMQAREIKKRDVTKEYHDSELLLHERQIALDRF